MPVSTNIDIRKLKERIEEQLKARKTNAYQTAIRAKLGTTAVNDILNGKNKNPSIPVLQKIAAVLQTTVGYLTGEESEEAQQRPQTEGATAAAPIVVAGIAEAGAFRAMPDFGQQEHELPLIIAPRSKLYPGARHFALEVRGDSMNAAKPTPIIEGMYVLCIDVENAGLMVESGRIYAVRRTIDGGQTYECTIKRAKVFKDRIELHPESTNRAHVVIAVPRDDSREIIHKVEAIGLVYGTFNSYEM